MLKGNLKVASVWFLGFILTLSSHAAGRSQIKSDFSIFLPQQFVRNLIEKKWEPLANERLDAAWHLPDKTIQAGELPVQIHDIHLQIKTFLDEPAVRPDENILRLSSKNLQAQVRIGNVEIDHVIEREIGGVIVRFRIQAQCQNVTLNLDQNEGSVSLDLAPKIGQTDVSTQLIDYALQWTGRWSSPVGIKCTGAKGFEDLVRDEVQRVADNWKLFLEPHHEQLKSLLDSYLQKYRIEFAQVIEIPFPQNSDVTIQMQVQGLQSLNPGFSLNGMMWFNFSNETGPDLALKLKDSVRPSDSKQATLLLPKGITLALLKNFIYPRSWHLRFESQKVEAFRDLQQNRWQQLFVWPDLLSYPKKANFVMDLYSSKYLNLQGGDFNFNIFGTVNSWMQAPRDGRYQRYMYFEIPIQGDSTFRVSGGKAQIAINMTSIDLKAYWDKEYLRNYKPNKYFDVKRIRQGLQQSITGRQFNWTTKLPKIQLSEGVLLKLEKAKVLEGGDLKLELSLQ